MADDGIIFEMWDDADEAQILALVRSNYDDIDTSYAEYFDWEYRRNPAGRAIIGCGKLEDGTVVTALATVPTPVLFRGERVKACQLVNGMTHSRFMGQGLFSKCGRMVCRALDEAGIALSYGFPNPNSFPSLTRKIGYADIGRARLLLRPHRPAALASTRFPAARLLGLGGLDRMLPKALLNKPRARAPVTTRTSFDGLPMAQLRDEAELAVDIADTDWLNWRYVNVPRRPYRMIFTGDEARPLGIAVYRITKWDDVRIGTVNDLFLAPDCGLEAVESLMHHVFGECEESDCAATFCLVSPSSPKLDMLKRAGFWVVPYRFEPQPFSVILRGHAVSISGITVNDMSVSFGAYDIF